MLPGQHCLDRALVPQAGDGGEGDLRPQVLDLLVQVHGEVGSADGGCARPVFHVGSSGGLAAGDASLQDEDGVARPPGIERGR